METKKATKIAKRLILGKNKPTPILRFLCWFTFIWDLLIALYFGSSGIVQIVAGDSLKSYEILKDFTPKFCFLMAGIHLASLFSAILMYRLNRSGFILYVISNISLTVLPFLYLSDFNADYLVVLFTLTMIGLFASQYKKLS